MPMFLNELANNLNNPNNPNNRDKPTTMIEFFLSFLILCLLVLAMAVGVLRGRAPIAGTCGGLNNIGVTGSCELCGGDMSKCDEVNDAESEGISKPSLGAQLSAQSRFYDAS